MSGQGDRNGTNPKISAVNRRNMLLGGTTLAAASAIATSNPIQIAQAQQQSTAPSGKKPNILVIFGDDIGQSNISSTPSASWAIARPTSIASPRKG